MKFAEGGYVDKPVIIQGDAESLIPDCHFGSLYKVLALDALLLELEESLENGTIEVSI